MSPLTRYSSHPRESGRRRQRERGSRASAGSLFLLGAGLILAGCSPGDRADGIPRVVATTGILGELVRQVGGDRIEVTTLMGPGIDPHLYRASAGDVRELAAADAIVFGGLSLEAAMAGVFRDMGDRIPTLPLLETIPETDRIPTGEGGGANWDPHLWLDPLLWSRTIPPLVALLERLDPGGRTEFRERGAARIAELRALDQELRSLLEGISSDRRLLVTSHRAFRYLGRAYGLENIGIQGASTAVEPSAADVRRVVDRLLESGGVDVVFSEQSVPPRALESIRAAAGERGLAVRVLGPLYSDALGPEGSGAESYDALMRRNAGIIADGLAGGDPGEPRPGP